jgi:hypothetical protein
VILYYKHYFLVKRIWLQKTYFSVVLYFCCSRLGGGRGVFVRYLLFLPAILAVFGCASAPTVEASREVLWQQFGDKPVDALIMAWGAPTSETALTDGARVLEYSRATIYDDFSSQRSVSCKVTFMAKPPAFLVRDVALQGVPSECSQLAKGHTGETHVPGASGVVGPGYPYRFPGGWPYGGFRYPF